MRAVDKNQSDPLSELKRLDETELKAAIKSAWKKHERLARKEMPFEQRTHPFQTNEQLWLRT
jgi:hypothetical protein